MNLLYHSPDTGMSYTELAAQLVGADEPEREALLLHNRALANAELARAIKAYYDDARFSAPARASGAAAALAVLARVVSDLEVQATAAWTSGRAALQLDGQVEQALAFLDQAAAQFEVLGQPLTTASVQVNRLHALAMLGRYDEAIACGLQARDVFVANEDILSAGQVEQNLGMVYLRRDQYREAELFHRMARERYLAIGDQQHLAQIESNLGYTLSLQHQFRKAAQFYEQALSRAESAGLLVGQAGIEGNLGVLALLQGRYDRALVFLERSRQKYETLDMPHELAVAEQDLADTYLELNLALEAAAIYAKVIPTFTQLGMRADQARALANHGRAQLLLGDQARAQGLLHEARALYLAEGNAVGAALVTLVEAQVAYATGDVQTAGELAEQAETPFVQVRAWGQLLRARWLRGEVARQLGQASTARTMFEATLRDAELWAVPQVAQRCHTSLGLLAAAAGDTAGAERAFQRAVAVIEALRAPLPAEELRTAFFSDKLTPYIELVRLCLEDPSTQRSTEALGYVERARSRALVDQLGSIVPFRRKPQDAHQAELLAQLEENRAELNWFYSQLNRPFTGSASYNPAMVGRWHEEIRSRETAVLELRRQLQVLGGQAFLHVEPLDIPLLQHDLGPDATLVEYFSLDGEILAFVVTNHTVEVVRHLACEARVETIIAQFRLQIDTIHCGMQRLRQHMPQLAARTRHHLRELYTLLIKPIAQLLDRDRLVIVPHRALHYIPFHALYDGEQHLIERYELCYVPSAQVLHHCLKLPQPDLQRAVLFGVPDPDIPRVRDELDALAPLFPETVTLIDERATLAALREHAPSAQVLHLACHGWFRPDNPLFSSLQLADAALTVRDAYELTLNCRLVALSACETGISAVAPGDELIGLARGFFAAGAPSLLVSLWRVDDATTAALMTGVYQRILDGEGVASALRAAQCELLRQHPHPFLWSSFALFGRW
jgi:CHAT domain-containing protein/tetratricopeptide (TPR) repeat protein